MNHTLFDYLEWRGDLSMEAVPFGEIDGMILSRFVYAPFEQILTACDRSFYSIEEVTALLLASDKIEDNVLDFHDLSLLETLHHSPRFQNLRIGRHLYTLDPQTEIQFCACTVLLPFDTACICYRGTDNTLIGWKENFNMGIMHAIPSQEKALCYLEEWANSRDGNLILLGHSKGGNIATYAGAMTSHSIQDRITAVYNFDGPGFDDWVLNNPKYARIQDRIHTFVPQNSMVGMLLGHLEEHTVIHSNENFIPLQHNLYSWEISGGHFITEDSVTSASLYLDHTMKDWLSNMDQKKREDFIAAIYSIIQKTDAHTLNDLKNHFLQNSKIILQEMKHMDEETKAVVREGVTLFMKSAKDSIGMLRGS